MPSGGGATAPSGEGMELDGFSAAKLEAAAAEAQAPVSYHSDFMVDSQGRIPGIDPELEGGGEVEQEQPGHSRVATPANSSKRVRSDEERRQGEETADMADSAAN